MNPEAATRHWHDVWEGQRGHLPTAPWLPARREAAFQRFSERGFPTRRVEAWRYTDLAPILRGRFQPAAAPADATGRLGDLLQTLPPVDEAARIVFANGHACAEVSDLHALPDGVRLTTLREALQRGDAEIEARLGSLANGADQPFEALNTALFTDGAVLQVASGVDLDRPIHVVFATVEAAEAAFASPRLLVLVGEGSRVSVLETWTGETAAPWLDNAVAEVWLGANARLDLLEVQRQPRDALHVRSLQVHQDRDSRFTSTTLSLGARLARNDLRIRLDAPGAECRLDGLSLVRGTQHVDHQIVVDHAKPHGTSHQLYKGILDDESTAAFAGGVLVRPQAQKTDARQANHNLLLSEKAQADSKPQLEIFADDVKCAHGATVGQLDAEAIFYLRSRGLDADAARRLLLRAFAGEVPARIEDEGLRAHAEATLAGAFGGGGA